MEVCGYKQEMPKRNLDERDVNDDVCILKQDTRQQVKISALLVFKTVKFP